MEKTKTKKEFIVDAKGKVLGRLATEIALILQERTVLIICPIKIWSTL
jgi:ribosomal protein L13